MRFRLVCLFFIVSFFLLGCSSEPVKEPYTPALKKAKKVSELANKKADEMNKEMKSAEEGETAENEAGEEKSKEGDHALQSGKKAETSASGKEMPGDLLYTGSPMGVVTFSHSKHNEKFSCDECHPDPFAKKKGSATLKMTLMKEGRYCGKCHNGEVAFIIASNCKKCHIKK